MTGARALLDELRPHIRDERVLAAIAAVPRTAFVPPERAVEAWANQALEIGCGQTISQPLVVARMAELLDVRPGDRVLDVGTGSGYHAAILAALGGHVWSVERHAELSAAAARALEAAGVRGVELVVGDGSDGLPAHGPYDAVNVAAATPEADLAPFEAQLAPRRPPGRPGRGPPPPAAAGALRARAPGRRPDAARGGPLRPARAGLTRLRPAAPARARPPGEEVALLLDAAQDRRGVEDERSRRPPPRGRARPRPTSPASTPWAAPARAASRRRPSSSGRRSGSSRRAPCPGAATSSCARRRARAPRARAARPPPCANAFVCVVACARRSAGRRPAAPSSPTSWGSTRSPRPSNMPLQQHGRPGSTRRPSAGSPGSRSKASVVGCSRSSASESEVCSSRSARLASHTSVAQVVGDDELDALEPVWMRAVPPRRAGARARSSRRRTARRRRPGSA